MLFRLNLIQAKLLASMGAKLLSRGLARDSNTISSLYQNCTCGQVTRSAKPRTFSPTVTQPYAWALPTQPFSTRFHPSVLITSTTRQLGVCPRQAPGL